MVRFRRDYRRRRFRRRRTFVNRRYLRSFNMRAKMQGLALFKLRTNPELLSDAGGEIAYGFSLTDIELTTSVNNAAYANAVQDLTSVNSLYDEYRVYGVKIQFTPYFPNNTTATNLYKAMYIYTDYDNTLVQTTYNAVSQYDNMKVRNLYRPWTFYQRVPKLINAGANYTVVGAAGWMDLGDPAATGHIGLVCEDLSANMTYGRLTVTYYVACKNRR